MKQTLTVHRDSCGKFCKPEPEPVAAEPTSSEPVAETAIERQDEPAPGWEASFRKVINEEFAPHPPQVEQALGSWAEHWLNPPKPQWRERLSNIAAFVLALVIGVALGQIVLLPVYVFRAVTKPATESPQAYRVEPEPVHPTEPATWPVSLSYERPEVPVQVIIIEGPTLPELPGEAWSNGRQIWR